MIPLRLAIFATTLLLTIGVLQPDPAYAEPQSLKLGGLFDLSSDAGKVWGTAEKNGFLLAIEDFQKSNPELTISHRIEDTQYSNARAVTAFQKLTSIDGIRFLVGPTFEVFVAVMPLCQAKQVICLAPSQHSAEFYKPTSLNRFAFTAWFDERGYSEVLADDIIRRDFRSVVVFGALSPYHDTLVDTLSTKIKDRIFRVERVQPQEIDFRTLISRIPKPADAVVMFFPEESALANFVSQWFQLRREVPIFYADDTIAYLPPDLLKRVQGYSPEAYYSTPKLPENLEAEFTRKYRQRFHTDPESPSASVAYDETTILLACMKTSLEVQKVRDCIAHTTNYQGYSGLISFDGKQSVTTRSFTLKRFALPSSD